MKTKNILSAVLIVSICVLAIAFFIKNVAVVNVNLLIWQFDTSVGFLLVGALAVGAISTFLLLYSRQQAKILVYSQRAKKLEKMLEQQLLAANKHKTQATSIAQTIDETTTT
jgi:uncharacterized integral membrane protein